MSEPSRPPTELEDWVFFNGRIEGRLKTGKRIITSRIVELHGDGVITKNRNPYKLMTCGIPKEHLKGMFSTENPLEAVLIIIEENKKWLLQDQKQDKAQPNANE